MQTFSQSVVETTAGTAIAIVLSIVVSIFLYPLFGAKFTLWQNFEITIIFTIISWLRSLAVRRAFNYIFRHKEI